MWRRPVTRTARAGSAESRLDLAKSAIRKIKEFLGTEADYAKYANDADLIAKGHVRPSAMGVWRAALATLRLEEAGQYYAPVFPPSV